VFLISSMIFFIRGRLTVRKKVSFLAEPAKVSFKKSVLIAFVIILSLSVVISFIIGYEIGARKQKEIGPDEQGIIVENYRVNNERGLEIQLKNTLEFPVEIIGFYTTNRSYPRGGISLGPSASKSFTLGDIVSGQVDEDYFIRINVYCKNLVSGEHFDSIKLLSGKIGEEK